MEKIQLEMVLKKYRIAIQHALADERKYSERVGYEDGHYWLHRKLDQITDEAEDHFLHDESTPHFPN